LYTAPHLQYLAAWQRPHFFIPIRLIVAQCAHLKPKAESCDLVNSLIRCMASIGFDASNGFVSELVLKTGIGLHVSKANVE
jgi:hypothetical protein